MVANRFYILASLVVASLSFGSAAMAAPENSEVSAGRKAVPVSVAVEPAAAGSAKPTAAKLLRERSTMSVVMDQALLVRSPESVRTIIVGNPAIADISSEGKGMLVVTGKSYGSTNLILVNGDGQVVGETLVKVTPARAGIVTVQKGDTKEAYSCNPACMPTAYVGSSPTFFSEATNQAQQKYGGSGAR